MGLLCCCRSVWILYEHRDVVCGGESLWHLSPPALDSTKPDLATPIGGVFSWFLLCRLSHVLAACASFTPNVIRRCRRREHGFGMDESSLGSVRVCESCAGWICRGP